MTFLLISVRQKLCLHVLNMFFLRHVAIVLQKTLKSSENAKN